MAHLYFGSGGSHSGMLRNALGTTESEANAYEKVIGIMTQMRTGDGSQDAHYEVVKDRFAFPDAATARAAFEEVSSYWGKINTDASVDHVKAAREQLLAKLG